MADYVLGSDHLIQWCGSQKCPATQAQTLGSWGPQISENSWAFLEQQGHSVSTDKEKPDVYENSE